METKFYNYRRNEAELNEEVIFCSNDKESSSHYGNILRIFEATEKTINLNDKNNAFNLINLLKEFISEWSGEKIDEESAYELLNPSNIVSSAGAWDNIEFINYLYDLNWFNNFDGVITNDGAIFFEVNDKNLKETIYL